MKTFSTAILAGLVLVYSAGAAGAQSKTLVGESETMTVTVAAIEQSSRTLTVQDADGFYETIQVPQEIKRFSELKVGDKITAHFYTNAVVRLKKPGEAAIDVDSASITAGRGQRPGGTAATQRTITATVVAIDQKVPSITVTGPNGWKYSHKVEDRKALAQVKVGDKLDITWTDALLISVDSAK